ncbi:hypothetical protein RHI9324_05047 [Rhizobium sp. CECT 9324]|nr:hypothetical protein RHI9324_05047 [Rhizobium sp. CECT 9324]
MPAVGCGLGLHVGPSRNGVELSCLADVLGLTLSVTPRFAWGRGRASRAGRGFAPSEPQEEGETPSSTTPLLFLEGLFLIGSTLISGTLTRKVPTRAASGMFCVMI